MQDNFIIEYIENDFYKVGFSGGTYIIVRCDSIEKLNKSISSDIEYYYKKSLISREVPCE